MIPISTESRPVRLCHRVVRGAALIALVSIEAGAALAALRLLHSFGGLGKVVSTQGDPAEAVGAAASAASALLAGWLLVGTLAYLALRAVGFARTANVLSRLTAPVARRAVDALFVAVVGAGTIASPAGASPVAPTPPVVVGMPGGSLVVRAPQPDRLAPTEVPPITAPDLVVRAPQPDPAPTTTAAPSERPATAVPPTAASPTTAPATTASPAAVPPTTASRITATPSERPPTTAPDVVVRRERPPSPATAAERTAAPPHEPRPPAAVTAAAEPPATGAWRHTVRAGESLWRVAADRVSAHLGRAAADNEVAPYWRHLVAANRRHLRSGDPSLVFPGEVLELPVL